MDFVYELYKNENFTTYLIIALVVLVALFIVVLIFGKKDQKLEETKKLQKIDPDAFKKENDEPKKIEVTENKKEEPVQEIKEEFVEEIEEVELPKPKEEVHVTEFEPETTSNEALLKDETSSFKFDEEGLEKDLQELENIKKEFSDIELPKVEEKKETTESKSNPQVYSSVYAPKNEEVKQTEPVQEKTRQSFIDDDGEEIELPTLK